MLRKGAITCHPGRVALPALRIPHQQLSTVSDAPTRARQFGATDVVTSRGEQGVLQVVEMTGGGADAVLECVGTEEAINMAVNMTRPGGTVGFVGAPHGSGQIPLGRMFASNIGLRGGLAPARAYLPELLADVLAGKLDPSPVLDVTVSLAEVAAGYAAMDQRQAIKVMVRPYDLHDSCIIPSIRTDLSPLSGIEERCRSIWFFYSSPSPVKTAWT